MQNARRIHSQLPGELARINDNAYAFAAMSRSAPGGKFGTKGWGWWERIVFWIGIAFIARMLVRLKPSGDT